MVKGVASCVIASGPLHMTEKVSINSTTLENLICKRIVDVVLRASSILKGI